MTMPQCVGRGGYTTGHCCYLAGKVCGFLVENQGGRRYACGLRLELGSWAAVNADPRYKPVGDHWASYGDPFNFCELYAPTVECCAEFRPGD